MPCPLSLAEVERLVLWRPDLNYVAAHARFLELAGAKGHGPRKSHIAGRPGRRQEVKPMIKDAQMGADMLRAALSDWERNAERRRREEEPAGV